MKKVIEFLKDENGQTSTEYILLVAVVAVIIYKFKNILSEKLMGLANAVFDNANNLAGEIGNAQ
jgi:pilus assembly protein Flp/PilA